MQFMLILAEDPDLVATDDDRQAAVQRVGEFAMGLVGDGVLKGGAPLHPVREAKKIRTRAGRQRVLDGPFAETKEVIAGYFVIEAPDMDAAVAIAARGLLRAFAVPPDSATGLRACLVIRASGHAAADRLAGEWERRSGYRVTVLRLSTAAPGRDRR